MLQQFAQLMGHGHAGGLRFESQCLDDLLELVFGAEGQIEKQDLFALELAAATAAAAEPFLANLVTQTSSKIDRLFQEFYRVHPSFSKQPAFLTGETDEADYSGFGYSCPADFDDTDTKV